MPACSQNLLWVSPLDPEPHRRTALVEVLALEGSLPSFTPRVFLEGTFANWSVTSQTSPQEAQRAVGAASPDLPLHLPADDSHSLWGWWCLCTGACVCTCVCVVVPFLACVCMRRCSQYFTLRFSTPAKPSPFLLAS